MRVFYVREACRRLSALAGRYAEGRVHSVFRRAVNVEVEGRLVCLLAAGVPLHPYGAVLCEAVDFEALNLAPGQTVVLGGNASGEEPRVSFRFRGADVYELSVEACAAELCFPDHLTEKLDILAHVISETPDAAQGLGPLPGLLWPGRGPALPTNHWCDFLLPRVRALPGLLRTGSADALAEAGRKLAGCGPGLTPSSDDFLVGLCAALWAALAAGLRPAARWAPSALAAGAGACTGAVSAAGLANAAEGLFSRDMLRLLAALFSRDGKAETAQGVPKPRCLSYASPTPPLRSGLAIKCSAFSIARASHPRRGERSGVSRPNLGANGYCGEASEARQAGLCPATAKARSALACEGERHPTLGAGNVAIQDEQHGLDTSTAEAAARVAAFGSTSGADTLVGLWFGLMLLDGATP